MLCDRPNLFFWFGSIDGEQRPSIESSFLPDWKTNPTCFLSMILWSSLISLLSAGLIFTDTKRCIDFWFLNLLCKLFAPTFEFSVSRFRSCLTLNAVHSGRVFVIKWEKSFLNLNVKLQCLPSLVNHFLNWRDWKWLDSLPWSSVEQLSVWLAAKQPG